MSENGLIELEKQGLLCGDKMSKLQFCETCILGKATRLKLTRNEHVTIGTLNYVHFDLWRPSRCLHSKYTSGYLLVRD